MIRDRFGRKKLLRGLPYIIVVGMGCGGSTAVSPPQEVAVSAHSRGQAEAEQLFGRAEQAAAKGDWSQAARLFAQAARSSPGASSTPLFNQALALERGRRYPEAAAVLRTLWDRDPSDARFPDALARNLIESGQLDEAERVLDRAIAESPNSLDLSLRRGQLHLRTRRSAKALGVGRKLLLRRPDDPQVLVFLASAHEQQGNRTLAEALLRRALEHAPKNPTVHHQLGLLLVKNGEFDRARLRLEEARKADPTWGAVWANAGFLALRFRDYGRAAENFQGAIDRGLETCPTATGLGYALEGLQKGEDAVQALSRARELCPEDQELLFTMGTICMRQLRDNPRALKYFEDYKKKKVDLDSNHKVFQYIRSLRSEEEGS